MVISSSTSSRARTVSSAVKIVTPFSTGALADLMPVGEGAGVGAEVPGIDDVAHIALPDSVKDLLAVLADLLLTLVRMPCFLRKAAVPEVASKLKPRW